MSPAVLMLVLVSSVSAREGVLIGPSGATRPASVLNAHHTAHPRDDSASHGEQAVVVRLGGSVTDASALGRPIPLATDAAPINLDLQGADIHSVLRFFAEVSGVNIITSDDVQGSVTVRLVDVPWDQALSATLHSLGLTATVFGERILLVQPIGAP